MDRNWQIRTLTLAMCVAVSGLGFAQEAPKSETAPAPAPTTEKDAKRAEAEKRQAEKKAEIEALKNEAKAVTQQLGKLAADGQLPTDPEGLAVMRQMLEQLEDINERLEKLENELKDITGWIEGQNESQPVLAFEVSEARRFRPSMYGQFQYRDSNRQTASAASRPSFFGTPFSGDRQSAFAFRRIRFGAQYTVDPKTLIRFSMDGSTGAGNDAFQLRDMNFVYTIQANDTFVPTELVAGQFALPLGYELERSSADREFPERAQYNRVMFNGERTRGFMLRHALSNNVALSVGAGSSLTFLDPEQSTRSSMPNGRMAIFGALRYETPTLSAGISHFSGERPSFQTAGTTGTATVGTVTVVTPPARLTAPVVDRRFTYVDASIIGLLDPKFTFRAEAMLGHDRIPVGNTQNAGTSSTANAARVDADNMTGFHLMGVYNLSSRVQLYGKFESFDPDTDQDDDAITGWGGGFRYFINPGASVNFTVESFRVPQFTQRRVHNVYTLRYQFRF